MGEDFFSLEIATVDGVHVFALRGELDVASSERLQQELTVATNPIVVGLPELTFIDSSGLTALIHAHVEKTGVEADSRCVAPPGSVRRVLEIAGLSKLLG